MRRKGARRVVVVLALLALSVLPLRAFCEWAHPHSAQAAAAAPNGNGGEESGLCCTRVDDNALLDSVTPVLSAGNGIPLIVAAVAPLMMPGAFAPGNLRLAGAPPPTRLSYYARSARILR